MSEFIKHQLCFRVIIQAVSYSSSSSVFRNPVGLLCKTTQFKLKQLYSEKTPHFITEVEGLVLPVIPQGSICVDVKH